MGGAEAAELAKLAETTYRDVNIAFANELARFADGAGIDVDRVIERRRTASRSATSTGPGIAVGGHCIPVYPRFFLEGDPAARLPAARRARSNEAMPAYAVELLGEIAGDLSGKRVLILGVAYRGGVKETAFSGAFARARRAARAAARVPVASDPLYSTDELRALGFEPWDGEPVDAAIVQADHASTPRCAGGPPGRAAILDGRGMLDAARFAAAGITALPAA